MFKKFLNQIFKCRHRNAILNNDEGYCPDCGKYIKKSYYVLRCANCGIKRHAKKKFDIIIPSEKFCTSCGSSDCEIEKYEKLNFVDINYAIEIKEVIENADYPINEIEIWIDENKLNTKSNFEEDTKCLPKNTHLLPKFSN